MLQYSGEKASDVGCGRNATIQKERYAAIHKLIFRKGVNRGVLHFMRFVPAIYFSFSSLDTSNKLATISDHDRASMDLS